MRHIWRACAALLVLFALAGCGQAPAGVAERASAPGADFAALEQRFHARVGVYAIDTGTGEEVAHRADERWAFCSTMKAFTAAAVLRHNTPGGLDRRISYTAADLVANSPVTEQHVGTGMTLRELIRAAVRDSDNTAQNLLLRELGGPAGMQRELRELGDTTAHVDRYEPDATVTAPGDIRDTSTPRAMAATLRTIALGDVLPAEQREVLLGAMRNSPLTAELIQAALPEGWRIEDKSGGGATYATRNDIAVLRPPNRAPIVMAIMTDRPDRDAEYDNALVAEAARLALDELR